MRLWRVPYPKFGAGPGLERVQRMASRLGLDLAAFGARGAVIVGSNGKGSTAAMTAGILEQASAHIGLFTSPHMLRLNERFRIDGEDIADSALEYHWARVAQAAADTGEAAQLGGFEFLFLIAADWFAARGCVHTIWEAGIGGRLDPVRLIGARRLALTSLDLEHTALLGENLDAIARDKLDAAPQGANVYVAQSCMPERDAITAHCVERGLKADFTPALVGAEVEGLSLAGAHQCENAALAVALARDLLGEDLSEAAITRALASVRWPGRLEVLARDPLVVIDVGHTPAAIRAALDGFEAMRGARPAVLVCGASIDKDVAAMIAALAPRFAALICTIAHYKGAAAGEVARHAQAANPSAEIIVAETVAEAHALASAKAHAENAAIYVAGGLFLAAEFKAAHLGRDPAALVFF